MKKDKKWFIDKWTKERDKTDTHDPMYHFINEFITDVKGFDEQDLPVVPTWFDKWWRNIIKGERNLFHNIKLFHDELYNYGTEETYDYINDPVNKKKLLNIIVNESDYVVEDEQKYYVMNEENELILGWSQSAYMTPCIEGYGYMKYNGRENLFQLTEQEIKDYDERYWVFAVEVEEVEKCYLF